MIEASSYSRKIAKNYANAAAKTFSQMVEAPSCIRKNNLNTQYRVRKTFGHTLVACKWGKPF